MLALLWCARARIIWHTSCSLMWLLTLLAWLAPREGLLPTAWCLAWRLAWRLARCVAAIRSPILVVRRWLAVFGAVRWSGRLFAGYDGRNVRPEEAAWRWPVRSGSRSSGLASGFRALRLGLHARLLL